MIALRLGRLDVQIVPGPVTQVVLAGRIDDSAPLAEALPSIPAGHVVIDTATVTFINSIGMREWMRFVRALHERGPVELVRVADVLITQMNLMPQFAQTVTIASFHAQYACAQCGAEHAPLIDVARYGPELRRLQPPKLPCPECGSAMELADFPERYLQIFRG